MNKSYFAISSRSILWARIVFGIALVLRHCERLVFLNHFSVRLPNLYSEGIDFANTGLVSGNVIIHNLHLVGLIILSFNFIWGKYFFKVTCLLLFALIQFGTSDGIYLGNGLRIILPMLLIWTLIPQAELRKENSLNPTKKYYSKSILFFHFYVSFVYFYTFYLKDHPVWNKTGEALTLFLMSGQWSLDWTSHLLKYPDFLKFANFTALSLELSAALVFMFGFLKWRNVTIILKLILCTCLALLHSIIGVATILHVFSLAMISCWILILPSFKSDSELISPENQPFKKVTSFCICSFLTLSLVLWNVFPKRLDRGFPVVQALRKVTLGQHWGLLSPAPGFYNYGFEIFKKSGNERVIIYSLEEEKHKKLMNAFLTSAFRSHKKLDIFGSAFCQKGSDIFATYRKFRIHPQSQTEIYESEKIHKISCNK